MLVHPRGTGQLFYVWRRLLWPPFVCRLQDLASQQAQHTTFIMLFATKNQVIVARLHQHKQTRGNDAERVQWCSPVRLLLSSRNMLYLIFDLEVNGALNGSWFPAVDGGSPVASALQSPCGPLQSTAVNGSYFRPVTARCSSHRADTARDKVAIYCP